MKDKNGVMIYEHDLIKIGTAIREIIYKRTCFQVKNNDSYPMTALYGTDVWTDEENEFEVVGNIFDK